MSNFLSRAYPGLLLATLGCNTTPPVSVDLSQPLPENLSELHFFTWEENTFDYNDGVLPYEVNTPLFTDYALKSRAMFLPEGTSATYDPQDALAFPVGTVLIKSFLFPYDFRDLTLGLRLVETRLLVHHEAGWKGYPYIWNKEGSEAILTVEGDVRSVEFIDTSGQTLQATHLIPQRNQCVECHELKDEAGERYTTPIGPKARHLNLDGQLQAMGDLGWLEGVPEAATIPQATDFAAIEGTDISTLSPLELETASRDYLDINCAHCHNPNGVQGITSQLFLNVDNDDDFRLGICKRPGSAGHGGLDREFDIVPGDAEASILVYRMATEEPGSMMPLIGRSLAHNDGVALISAWINQMEPESCE